MTKIMSKEEAIMSTSKEEKTKIEDAIVAEEKEKVKFDNQLENVIKEDGKEIRILLVQKSSACLGVFVAHARLLEHLLEDLGMSNDTDVQDIVKELRKQWTKEMNEKVIEKCFYDIRKYRDDTNVRQKGGSYLWKSDWYLGWVGDLESAVKEWLLERKPPSYPSGYNVQEFVDIGLSKLKKTAHRSGIVFDEKSFKKSLLDTLYLFYPSRYDSQVWSSSLSQTIHDAQNHYSNNTVVMPPLSAVLHSAPSSQMQRNRQALFFLRQMTGRTEIIVKKSSAVFRFLTSEAFQTFALSAVGLILLLSVPGLHLLVAGLKPIKQEAEELPKDVKKDLAFFQFINKIYTDQVLALDFAIQKVIAELDVQITRRIFSRDASWLKLLERRQCIFLCLQSSYETRKLCGWSVNRDRKLHKLDTIETEIFRLMAEWKRFSEQRNKHLMSLNNLINSIMNHSSNMHPSRLIIYLHGQPGVGKRHLVKQIAKVLRLPLWSSSVTSMTDIDRLTCPGSLTSVRAWADDGITEEQLLSIFPYLILYSGCANPIVYLNNAENLTRQDIDRKIPTLLREDYLTLKGDGVAFQIDVSRVIVIITGNEPLEKLDPCPAWKDCITHEFELPSFTQEEKRRAFGKCINDLGDTERKAISHEAREECRKLLSHLVEIDINPGIHTAIRLIRGQIWDAAIEFAEMKRAPKYDDEQEYATLKEGFDEQIARLLKVFLPPLYTERGPPGAWG